MIRLDGGLATTLNERGLSWDRPVDDWLLERTDAIEAVHRDFVAAGAEIVLSATFRALPSLQPRWAEITDLAVEVALRAGVPVWASIGPASTFQRAWRTHREPGGWGALAERCLDRGAAGVVLETFTDADELRAALADVLPVARHLPVIASLAPREDGLLFDGSDPKPILAALLDQGAAGVGFNCGTGPASVEAAVARCDGVGPLWAKPSAMNAPPKEVVAALARLAERCRWVGGCCGVGPDLLRAWT
jgi:methionine synthase I (cobalamin-dependent)